MKRKRRIGRPSIGSATFAVLVATLAVVTAACGEAPASPSPTPADAQGIRTVMHEHGIDLRNFVSGDAGCTDRDLTQLAIGVDASGVDQPGTTRVHLYLFRNREVYDRLRAKIDACARDFVASPDDFGLVEAPPYVAAGPGPWTPAFTDALRQALTQAVEQGG